VGVALARPDQKVIALIGDGVSLYSIQALWSAAQLKRPITFIILKNGRYAALQDFAPSFGCKSGEHCREPICQPLTSRCWHGGKAWRR